MDKPHIFTRDKYVRKYFSNVGRVYWGQITGSFEDDTHGRLWTIVFFDGQPDDVVIDELLEIIVLRGSHMKYSSRPVGKSPVLEKKAQKNFGIFLKNDSTQSLLNSLSII